MVKKPVIITLSILASVALAATGIFVYQNMREHGRYVTVPQQNLPKNSQLSDTDKAVPAKTILQGEFMGRDAVHRASGQAVVSEVGGSPILEFKDFSVTPGPDLFVYLSPNGPSDDLGAYVSLDHLKATTGQQTYNLPPNYKDYQTVVIWCRSFSVTFATAELKPVQ